jgi:hypothetical protein
MSLISETPSIVLSPHVSITFAFLVTLVLLRVSRKRPSLRRFAIITLIVIWIGSAAFYLYAFCVIPTAYIYVVETIISLIITVFFARRYRYTQTLPKNIVKT